MANTFIFINVLVFVGLTIWNGLHGKGYKVVFKLPQAKPTTKVIARALVILYCLLIEYCAVISILHMPGTSKTSPGIKIFQVVLFLSIGPSVLILGHLHRKNK
jgi:hypothetical protein